MNATEFLLRETQTQIDILGIQSTNRHIPLEASLEQWARTLWQSNLAAESDAMAALLQGKIDPDTFEDVRVYFFALAFRVGYEAGRQQLDLQHG